MTTQTDVGLVVIGNELLSGKRQDRHTAHVIDALRPRGMELAWARMAGDDLERLVDVLRQTQQDCIPVFCFGGIGATPDDRTRQAAAQAFDTTLVLNQEAVAVIEERFGEAARPHRIRMAELPRECTLIPNPYNRIPGFSLYEHHFLPGFPEMAWPMLDWVLDTFYPYAAIPVADSAVRIDGVAESDLVELMQELQHRHAKTRLYSLPHLGEERCIELGFRGDAESVTAAFVDLVSELKARALSFELLAGQDMGISGA